MKVVFGMFLITSLSPIGKRLGLNNMEIVIGIILVLGATSVPMLNIVFPNFPGQEICLGNIVLGVFGFWLIYKGLKK